MVWCVPHFVSPGTSGDGAQHGGFQQDLRQRELQGAGHAAADSLPTGVRVLRQRWCERVKHVVVHRIVCTRNLGTLFFFCPSAFCADTAASSTIVLSLLCLPDERGTAQCSGTGDAVPSFMVARQNDCHR